MSLLTYELTENELIGFNLTTFFNEINDWYDIIGELSTEYNCSIDSNLDNLLINSLQNLKNEIRRTQYEIDNLDSNDNDYNTKVIHFNKLMRNVGKQFLYENGLPGRSYYKNIVCFKLYFLFLFVFCDFVFLGCFGLLRRQLTAPSLDTGYTGQYFPYIAYAVKFNCTDEMLEESYNITSTIIDNAAAYIVSFVTETGEYEW